MTNNVNDGAGAMAENNAGPVPLHVDNYLLGMVCALGAYCTFALMNALAKLLSANHHVVEIAFYRNLFAVLPFLFVIYAMGKRDILIIRGKPTGIIIRSVLGTLSLIVTFAAFSVMPMADTTAFLFTSSLIVPALGFFFLGERVGVFRWSAIIIGFIGVLIMLQPDGQLNTLGASLALGAALLHAALQTVLRSLGKVERPETVTFYFLLIGTCIAAIPMPFVYTVPEWKSMPLLVGIGACGAVAQLLLSAAYRNAPANIITVFNYSGIIWATAFGWFIWNDWPTAPIWVGGAIVIISNIFILWRETRLARAARRAEAGNRIEP